LLGGTNFLLNLLNFFEKIWLKLAVRFCFSAPFMFRQRSQTMVIAVKSHLGCFSDHWLRTTDRGFHP
jgi:hypothetical protein